MLAVDYNGVDIDDFDDDFGWPAVDSLEGFLDNFLEAEVDNFDDVIA